MLGCLPISTKFNIFSQTHEGSLGICQTNFLNDSFLKDTFNVGFQALTINPKGVASFWVMNFDYSMGENLNDLEWSIPP